MELENIEVNVFKALAHPLRLKIVKKLGEKELCVYELNENMGFSQPNLSQHLKILKEAQIVISEKGGLKINYKLKSEKILDVIKVIEGMIIDDIKEINKKIGA